jgi:hypothetical protein
VDIISKGRHLSLIYTIMIEDLNWVEIQSKYDIEKISERDICKFYGLSESRLHRAKKKGLFKTRDKSELIEIITEKSKNRRHSEETKKKISEIRKKYLSENPDKVPYLLNHSSEESYPEKYFSKLFENENIVVLKSFRIGLYELDFCIPDKRIDIEIDGSQHYCDSKIVESDIKRTKFLEENGWDVIRVNWGEYQKMNFDEKSFYINGLKEYINKLTDEKPTIIYSRLEKGHDLCECGGVKWKASKMCLKCRRKIKGNSDKILKQNLCDCGNIKNEKSKRCKRCGDISGSMSQRKVERPSYDQLKKDVESFSHRVVAKKYGVGKSTISKWLKYYKTHEI